jgi:hypothetical protein
MEVEEGGLEEGGGVFAGEGAGEEDARGKGRAGVLGVSSGDPSLQDAAHAGVMREPIPLVEGGLAS